MVYCLILVLKLFSWIHFREKINKKEAGSFVKYPLKDMEGSGRIPVLPSLLDICNAQYSSRGLWYGRCIYRTDIILSLRFPVCFQMRSSWCAEFQWIYNQLRDFVVVVSSMGLRYENLFRSLLDFPLFWIFFLFAMALKNFKAEASVLTKCWLHTHYMTTVLGVRKDQWCHGCNGCQRHRPFILKEQHHMAWTK